MSATVKVTVAVAVVVAAAIGFWLLRPLFVDEVVDEAFPVAAAEPGDPEGAAATQQPAVPDEMTSEEVEAEMAVAAAAPATEEVEPMPDGGPVAVVSGSFTGADSSHQGSGTATIYEVDGANVLRLEDFEVTNGPDLHVYLAPIGADGAPDIDAGTDLGELRGNIGDQNYDIPADVDLSQPLAVVIWCQPFRVTFATALLA